MNLFTKRKGFKMVKCVLTIALMMMFLLNLVPVNLGTFISESVKAAALVSEFPYYNSFEVYPPLNWVVDGKAMMLSTNTNHADGTYSLKLYTSGGTANDDNPASLYLPINAIGKDSITISFCTKGPSSAPNNKTTFQISYDSGESYQTLYTFSSDSINGEANDFSTQRTFTLDLASKTDIQKSQIRVRFTSGANNNNGYWVDKMEMTTTASTIPDVTDLVMSDRSNNSVSLSWNAGAGEAPAGYDVYVNGSATSAASVTSTTATITGLSIGTTYNFTVRARTAAGVSSNGVSISASTLGVSVPYNDRFDDTTTALPTNWGYTAGTGVGILKCTSGSKRSGSYGLKLAANSPSTSANAYLSIDGTGKRNLLVSFYCKTQNASAITGPTIFEVSYNGGTDWSTVYNFSDKLANNTFGRFIFALGPEANSNPDIKIRFNTTNTNASNFYAVDDLSITENAFSGNIQSPIVDATSGGLTGLKVLSYSGAPSVDVVVAKYDTATNTLKAVEVVKDVALQADTLIPISMDTPMSVVSGETIKAFVWDDLNYMQPLTNYSDILAVQ